MRGSITQVSGDGSGCILAEDGNEVCFERSGIGGSGVDDLMVGHWVEFKLQYGAQEIHTPEKDGNVLANRIRADQQAVFEMLHSGESGLENASLKKI